MKQQHARNNLGERVVTLGEALDRFGGAFRAAGIHPYYVMVPGEEPGEHHVAVCMDAYAAAACLHGASSIRKETPPGTTD